MPSNLFFLCAILGMDLLKSSDLCYFLPPCSSEFINRGAAFARGIREYSFKNGDFNDAKLLLHWNSVASSRCGGLLIEVPFYSFPPGGP